MKKNAKEAYLQLIKSKHKNFSINESGLFINPQFPQFGATPDGIVRCECCGVGVLEVKCPYCRRNDLLNDEMPLKKNFCLQVSKDGCLKLSKTHSYYYQVQTQIFICDKDFADFVVWTEKVLHIERVSPDESFWSEKSKRVCDLFHQVIMPELVAKYFSLKAMKEDLQVQKPTDVTDDSRTLQDQTTDRDTWCLCQDKEDGKMIACDNSDCPFVWFHYACVGIKRKPKGMWFCPKCKQTKC